MSDYLDELVEFVCNCTFDDLPPETIKRSKSVLADSISVIAAGAQEKEVKAMTQQIARASDPHSATIIGAGRRRPSH